MDWDNKEEVLKKVMLWGYLLQHASDRLKDDYDVVLTAVRKNGYALAWASDRLRDNEDIVLTAVTSNGDALQDASERLRYSLNLLKQISYDSFPGNMTLLHSSYNFFAAEN